MQELPLREAFRTLMGRSITFEVITGQNSGRGAASIKNASC